jgi:hypothetical protein
VLPESWESTPERGYQAGFSDPAGKREKHNDGGPLIETGQRKWIHRYLGGGKDRAQRVPAGKHSGAGWRHCLDRSFAVRDGGNGRLADWFRFDLGYLDLGCRNPRFGRRNFLNLQFRGRDFLNRRLLKLGFLNLGYLNFGFINSRFINSRFINLWFIKWGFLNLNLLE